jgi:lysophospholipase L1-like esterase
LVYHPDRPDLLRAWKITLQNLGKIFDYAKARNIPVILVVFPFTFQFDDVSTLSAPQKIVSKYASDNKVPVIDLLPILSEKMQEEWAKLKDLFLDVDHLSPVGSEIVAEVLADFIQKERLITDKREK